MQITLSFEKLRQIRKLYKIRTYAADYLVIKFLKGHKTYYNTVRGVGARQSYVTHRYHIQACLAAIEKYYNVSFSHHEENDAPRGGYLGNHYILDSVTLGGLDGNKS